jgi:hypothetical protein
MDGVLDFITISFVCVLAALLVYVMTH